MRYELSDFEWTAIKPMLPNKMRGGETSRHCAAWVGLRRADGTTPTEANFFGYNHSEARRPDNGSDTGHLAGNPGRACVR